MRVLLFDIDGTLINTRGSGLTALMTAFYTFRLVFMTFHGPERMDEHTREHLHESPWVVTVPLVLLAIPSVAIGWPEIGPLLFGSYWSTRFIPKPGARTSVAVAGETSTYLSLKTLSPLFSMAPILKSSTATII